MRKAIWVVVALMLVVSGVAAVSAYEAHTINVTAHVENAMKLMGVGSGPDYHWDFGTVFPEEWLLKEFTVGMSDSFCNENQWRMTKINYSVWVDLKPDDGNGGYYPWLGDALYIGVDTVKDWPNTAEPPGDLLPVGSGTPPILVVSDNLSKFKNQVGDQTDNIIIGLDVPVFEGYYNQLTDPTPKPSHLNAPTVILSGDRNVPEGITLGADIIIQVTSIYNSTGIYD